MEQITKKHRISGTQQGLYIECMNLPDSTVYNIPILYRLPKELDIPRFLQSFNDAVAWDQGLRTRFELSEDGTLSQYIDDQIPKVQIIHTTEAEFNVMRKSLVKVFDLTKDQLLRATMYVTEENHWFFMDVHHMIFDGFSHMYFSKQLAKLYNGEKLTEYACDGIDVARSEQEISKSEEYTKAKEHFLRLLDDAECDIAPLADVEGKAPAEEESSLECPLTVNEIDEFCKEKGITKTVFFTAVAGFLSTKYAFRDKTAIATVYNGRNRPEYKNAVTMLVKTLPFVTDLSGVETVSALLKNASEQLHTSRKYSFYPFSDIAAQTGAGSDILFAYQGKIKDYCLIDGIDIESCRIHDGSDISQIKISAELTENKKGTFNFDVRFRSDIYSREFIEAWQRSYLKIIKEFLTKEQLCEISILDAEDEQTIREFNKTSSPVCFENTVVEMFRKQAEKAPENTAVVYLDKSLTYGQLDEESDRIAAYIQGLGLTSEDVVAILVPRSEYIALLPMAVSKAGCAYQPLDPSYPPERLNFMVSDSKAKLLIVHPDLRAILNEYTGHVLYLNELENLPPCTCELPKASPKDLFTLLYTSGSTGVPKGCMLEYGNITAFCNWFGKFYGIDPSCKYAAYASFGFDACMMDTYGTLTNGGEMHILPEDIRLDFVAIGEYFEANGITHTFMTTQIGRQFAVNMKPKGLKYLSTGGEKLVPCDPPEGYAFYNLYGPTECTILTTQFKVDKYYNNIPIGRPLDNFKLYVTDKWGNMLPPGACGELMISGYQVSRGYLNRPEKTAEVYTENKFDSDEGYERLYHSGDVVRYLPDGNIQIIGRQDGQVKVRGFRIELTEVEEIIRRYPTVKDATVAAFDDPAGGKYVAAYVVSDETVDIEKLHAFIAQEKPPYMVPAVTMQIDHIPVNQNQKVNKRALPVPERKTEEKILPKTDIQQKIYDILAEVLGHKDFGITSNIYMSGITSISAVQLNMLLSKEFDRPIKTSDLKEYDTVEKLELLLSSEAEKEVFEILEKYPLTKTQEGIFIECIAHPGSTIYNIPILLKTDESLDKDGLLKAISDTVNAHPYIMTELEMDGQGEISLLRPRMTFDASQIHTGKFNSKEELLSELKDRPFELIGGRLFRIGLYQVGDHDTYLYLEFHHIICDGTSLVILLEDISRAYSGEALKTEAYSGFEASLTEQRDRKSKAFDKAKEYFDKLFTGCDADCLPKGNVKDDAPRGESTEYYTKKLTAEKVLSYCKNNSVTANGFFTAAFGLTLAKFSGKDQAVFTTIYDGRNDSRLHSSVSMYVKTYPVLCDVGNAYGKTKTKDYIRSISTQLENSMANDIYSFGEISRAYQINADVMFAYQGDSFVFDRLCEKPCEMEQIELDQIKAPLNINVFIEGNKIRLFCEYRGDRFDLTYINVFLDSLETAAEELISKDIISQVSVLSSEEKNLLDRLNQTQGTSYSSYISLPRLLDEQIAENPDKIAVYAGAESITYATLGSRSNSVANGLVSLGVCADQAVALMLHRTVDVYPVRQGILKSGGAFLSLEPDYPADRVSYILNTAEVSVLITTREIYAERKELLDKCGVTVAFTDELYKYDGSMRPQITIDPDQLAYCIFTSGSTGNPKGVKIRHRNLLNLIDHHDNNNISHYYLDGTQTMLALAAITFDVSVLEEFIPLYHGKSVAMATQEEIHNPILLAQMMEKTGVDVMKCTPSYIQTVFDIPVAQKAFANLKAICIGAEPFPQGLYEKMRQFGIKGRIYNSYGPSETTVTVTIDHMTDENISIGKPVGNTEIRILDTFGNELPRFAPGEITVVGKSVGSGYMNLDDVTAEKFIAFEGAEAYKSGDIGLWNGRDKIECKGRRDNQVKLRGLRIELDEIEKVMTLFDGIDRSVVLVKENESGQYLCGYYTADAELFSDELTSFMKTKLTDYMIPGVFVYMEKFPMTANGKIDKRGLPEPTQKKTVRNGEKASNELEKTFCDMFARVLGIDQVFADDDFFALGGTSLSASKIAMQCMMQQLPVAYGNVFEFTTPKALAEFVSGNTSQSEEKNEVRSECKSDDTRPSLSHNRSEYAHEITQEPVKKVLVSGCTGFLGIHVVKELLEQSCEKVFCLVRKGSLDSAEERLKTLLMYYFDDVFEKYFRCGTIKVIEADITDTNLTEQLCDCDFDTIINCAAIVKHFAFDDTIEQVNVQGVKNLIEVAKAHDAKMIQISTVSVAGESINNSVPAHKVITEDALFFGQGLENRYVNTKFRAEEAMLEAMENGMRGKIIRVGNLMSREQDGEFQINYLTNGFMSRLKAYAALQKFPVGSSDAKVEFSPIDCVAKAVVLLSGTNDSFTVFHAYNCHHIHMANVISAMNTAGLTINVVEDDEYIKHFKKQLANDKMNMKISSLISYNSADGEEHRFIGSDNTFTIKVLYRLGFSWPIISESYVNRAIDALSTLNFFENEE